MRKLLVAGSAALALVLMVGMGASLFSTYGRVTGYATIENSLEIDIIGSSNDTYYTLKSYQGESIYSPKIKLVNRASVPINVTLNVTFEPNSDGIKMSLWNENKTEALPEFLSVPPSDMYFYILHEFRALVIPGNYTFQIDVVPA